MYEVEIKVPADLDATRERLREVGAEHVAAKRQRDTYYDAPHREFAETDEALRIRREMPLSDGEGSASSADDPAATITYKGPLLDEASKTRAEHETGVDDGEALAAALSGLGFEPAATVEKRREFWAYDGFTVTLDAVTGLDEYVEIERAVESEGEVDAAREAAIEALDRLGLDADDQVRTSYLGLLLAGEDD
ncbi:class IV adenylate cyclase [Halorubrum ezzemoulense]|jgi:adenylate cyclase class 2|uniref:Adenylate cyclase n=1 Tax=Halorubrum ezzemoulense TaxID=337243 RepID=A0A256JY26_HALEZ|nr:MULTISPECIES: class IV adenylate cyclase [Halorubrum]MDB2242312.1 class IV adenylate cyclase [Halorubrum ezzemoulense]MDB2263153.1 class IV adenylate cyclase [Halorubrum ezzemoulense]MDB2269926.1 class IV adenylate cyclase [Halorubrum ezzemoulense]MDB2282931.1 class IV adenylate cyclase [Halorubrum ezzemoulense]MDB9248087.1 class IV adenylate cyclase [Halorubrum ezzemoulense]